MPPEDTGLSHQSHDRDHVPPPAPQPTTHCDLQLGFNVRAVQVATPEDAQSAQLGELLYAFLPRIRPLF